LGRSSCWRRIHNTDFFKANALVRAFARIRTAVKNKSEVVTIPVSAMTEISYGQDVHRRLGTAIGFAVLSLGIGALMLLSKSKKH
jgi:hypothetical protein